MDIQEFMKQQNTRAIEEHFQTIIQQEKAMWEYMKEYSIDDIFQAATQCIVF